MTALSPRQSTKVRAALSLIAQHGHNPRKVQQQAQALISQGTPANQAYSSALNAFANRVPGIRSTLEIAMDVVQNSDDATLAIYDKAMAAYNDSGDAGHLEALAPMILEDAKALAIRNGEVTAEDAAGWDMDDALGIREEAFAEVPDVPDALTPADGSPQTSQFQFNGQQQTPTPAPATPAPAAPSAPAGWSVMGYSPAHARAAEIASQGYSKPSHTVAENAARKWLGTATEAEAG